MLTRRQLLLGAAAAPFIGGGLDVLPRRLLLAALGGGSFDVPGYPMTPDEVTWWQHQAALLDPLAYEFVNTTATTRTVPADLTWYCLNAWKVNAVTGLWYHRSLDVERAWPMAEGTSLVTSGTSGSSMYLCKPELVTDPEAEDYDARYTTDPRGLWASRIRQLGTLPQYQITQVVTDGSNQQESFPTDFDYGMLLQVSVHDVAWLILRDSIDTGGLNTLPEVSDVHQNRYAEKCVAPFVRATFPKIEVRGVSESEGAAAAWYAKLPEGW